MLTAERLRELLDYDPSTGILRWRVDRAYVVKSGARAGSIKQKHGRKYGPYRVIIVDGNEIAEHVAAWMLTYGHKPLCKIVHLNGDRTDNRLVNLAEVDAERKGKDLSLERLRDVLDYDAGTGLFRWKTPKTAFIRPGDVASNRVNSQGYVSISIDGTYYKAHRLAWLYVHGVWPIEQIDHINGRRNDNRIMNLRQAERSQNAKNRKRNANNKSGFKGVHALNGGWAAQIKVDGVRHHLGTFPTAEIAARAYAEASARLHGEFGRSD